MEGEERPKHFDANGYKHVVVGGVVQPPFMRASVLAELQRDFTLRDTDIVIATYPKCGTTWMQQILLTLQFGGDGSKAPRPMAQSPWVEANANIRTLGAPPSFQGEYRSVQELLAWDGGTEFGPTPGRRVWKTHAPVELAPWRGGVGGLGGAKVVVVTRNPKDACVSMYHHSRDVSAFEYSGDMRHFVAELFLAGNVESGCFWAWHAGWQRAAAAGPAGVLWISYEELARDPVGGIRRVAEFAGIPASDDAIARTAQAASFPAMKRAFADADAKMEAQGIRTKKNHIRRGEVGSWRADIRGGLLDKFDEVHRAKCAEHGLSYQFDFGGAPASRL